MSATAGSCGSSLRTSGEMGVAFRSAKASAFAERKPTLGLAPQRPAPSPVPHRVRRGYTLAEMLIVVTIMIMLVAVTLPVAKKMMDGSQVREASRQLHAYVAMAKARALQTGRPCGLYLSFPTAPLGVLEPDYTQFSAAQFQAFWPVRHVTQLYLAETPPPYSGGTTNTLGKIWDPTGAAGATAQRVFQPVLANGSPDNSELPILQSLIEPGEVFEVRFNYKGEWYRCKRGIATDATFSNPAVFYYINIIANTGATNTNITAPFGYNDTTTNNSGGRPFQILRSPRPVGNPLELPNGSCIDITYCGVGSSARQFRVPAGVNSALTGLTVLLSTNGGVDAMYLDTANARRLPMLPPTGSLFFLLGKVEKAGDPTSPANFALTDPTIFADPEQSNLADPHSLWVVLNRGTGQVSTAENTPPPIDRASLSASSLRLFPGEQAAPAGRFLNIDATQQNAVAAYLTYCREGALRGEQAGGQ